MKSLSTEAIIAMLDPDKQKELFYALQMIVPREPRDIRTRIGELETKYWDLVWMARKRPEDLLLPQVKNPFDEVNAKYPGELEKLQGEEGDWTHGFNSGMLACLRLLSSYALPHNFEGDECEPLDPSAPPVFPDGSLGVPMSMEDLNKLLREQYPDQVPEASKYVPSAESEEDDATFFSRDGQIDMAEGNFHGSILNLHMALLVN